MANLRSPINPIIQSAGLNIESKVNPGLKWFLIGLGVFVLIIGILSLYFSRSGMVPVFVVEKVLDQLLFKERKYDFSGALTSNSNKEEWGVNGSMDFSDLSKIAFLINTKYPSLVEDDKDDGNNLSSFMLLEEKFYKKREDPKNLSGSIWVTENNEGYKISESDLRNAISIFKDCNCMVSADYKGTEKIASVTTYRFGITLDIPKLGDSVEKSKLSLDAKKLLITPFLLASYLLGNDNPEMSFLVWIDADNNLRRIILSQEVDDKKMTSQPQREALNFTVSLTPNRNVTISTPEKSISYEEYTTQEDTIKFNNLRNAVQRRISYINQLRVAIELFKQEKGYYPESFEVLVPHYLPQKIEFYPLGYLTAGSPPNRFVVWTNLFIDNPALDTDDDVDATGPEWTVHVVTNGSPQRVKINGTIENCAYSSQHPSTPFDCFYDLSDKSSAN